MVLHPTFLLHIYEPTLAKVSKLAIWPFFLSLIGLQVVSIISNLHVKLIVLLMQLEDHVGSKGRSLRTHTLNCLVLPFHL